MKTQKTLGAVKYVQKRKEQKQKFWSELVKNASRAISIKMAKDMGIKLTTRKKDYIPEQRSERKDRI